MPHIPVDRRELCRELPNVQNWGELHYYFGQQMQMLFLQDPSYKTLRDIRRFYVQGAKDQKFFKEVRKAFNCPIDDVLNEAALAWEEFYLSVGHTYEEAKALMNAPHAYAPALEKIRSIYAEWDSKRVIKPAEIKKP